MKVSASKLRPIKDRVLFSDMEFGEEKTKSGIILRSDDGKVEGIKPRWGKVWAIGPDQTQFKVGDWILIEHGRWSRKAQIENEDGSITYVQMADLNAIMAVSDEKPSDVMRQQGV
jgi:co-chaperonin GroES (HSP10)